MKCKKRKDKKLLPEVRCATSRRKAAERRKRAEHCGFGV